MPILLDELLCLSKWVIRNNAIWKISERMKFMKLYLYKSGFFLSFRVCVLCVYVYSHVCTHVYERMCIWWPQDDVRSLFQLLFYLVLWGRISQSDLAYSLPVQLVLLVSLLQRSVSTFWGWDCRHHLMFTWVLGIWTLVLLLAQQVL